MIKTFCDICGTETDAAYNCFNLRDRPYSAKDGRHLYANEICHACASRLLDTIEGMKGGINETAKLLG